jgi:hypothetical protein
MEECCVYDGLNTALMDDRTHVPLHSSELDVRGIHFAINRITALLGVR